MHPHALLAANGAFHVPQFRRANNFLEGQFKQLERSTIQNNPTPRHLLNQEINLALTLAERRESWIKYLYEHISICTLKYVYLVLSLCMSQVTFMKISKLGILFITIYISHFIKQRSNMLCCGLFDFQNAQ